MRQIYHTTGHRAYDLTECRVHRLVDKSGKAKFVVCWPVKWVKLEPQQLTTHDGKQVTMCGYSVTEWAEAELDLRGRLDVKS